MELKVKTELYDYQQEAVSKLSRVTVGALYMEMGTGKTRTALELIRKRAQKDKINHIIWLCPFSIKTDVERNIQKHMEIPKELLTICGIESLSSSHKTVEQILDLAMVKECYLIVDESNLVKNPFAIRSQNTLRVAQNCKYKLLLNGTPITKTEADLFSQWQILDWRILGYRSYYSFAANHLEFDDKYRNKIRRVLNVDYLTDKISPYTYQVRKDECLNLPNKRYVTHYFSLTDEQKEHYLTVAYDFLSPSRLIDNTFEDALIYRTFTALQQITSGERIITSASQPIKHEPFFKNIESNPRITALLNVMSSFSKEKVIIFCRFLHEIESIYTVLSRHGYSCQINHGGLTKARRQYALDEFEKHDQVLISSKSCASYGLNLQFCSNIIYYNNDWDWGTRVQSEDRIHRIGQQHPITIVDLCASSKIDERIQYSLSRKECLTDRFKKQLGKKNLIKWLGMEEENDTNRIN